MSEISVPQEVLDRVDLLAEKLGVAAGHIWEMSVNQAVVEGYIGLTWSVFLAVLAPALGVTGVKLIKWGTKLANEDRYGNGGGAQFIWGGLASIFSAASLIGLPFAVVHAIRHLANPEFQALNYIISRLTG